MCIIGSSCPIVGESQIDCSNHRSKVMSSMGHWTQFAAFLYCGNTAEMFEEVLSMLFCGAFMCDEHWIADLDSSVSNIISFSALRVMLRKCVYRQTSQFRCRSYVEKPHEHVKTLKVLFWYEWGQRFPISLDTDRFIFLFDGRGIPLYFFTDLFSSIVSFSFGRPKLFIWKWIVKIEK